MKKNTKFALVSLIGLGLMVVGLTATINYNPLFADVSAPEELNCSYYFNSNNGYTSIRDLNEQILNGEAQEDYKTWGTITCKYLTKSSGGYTCYFVQSTDKYGRKAGILLYNALTTNLEVGNVVTITGGTPTMYRNSTQISGATLHLDYETNSSPVEITQATSDNFDPDDYREAVVTGPLFVSCSNVTVISVEYDKALIQFSDGQVATAYYNSSSVSDAVKARFNNLLDAKATVKGHINRFDNDFQLYVRDPAYVENYEAVLCDISAVKKNNNAVPVGSVPSIDDFIVTAYYSDASYSVVKNAIITDYSTSDVGTGYVDISYTEGNITKTTSVSFDVDDLFTFDLSGHYIDFDKNYSTGNYGSSNGFGFYRAKKNNNSTYTLLPYTGDINVNALEGAFYNTNSYDDISSISLTYRTSGGNAKKPSISYGEQNYTGVGRQDINYSSSSRTVEFDLVNQNVNYFMINSGDATFTIEGLVIGYKNSVTQNGSSFVYSNCANDYRINPTVATGTLVDGVTSVTVPVDVSISGNSYTVNQYKIYTYYTYSYAQSHPEMVDEIAMTDPMDVANYYTIFQQWPANYCLKGSFSTYEETFGNLTRCVSEYDRTNGYARAVPYAVNPDTNKPLYYEFDIALDSSYSSSNRGVGRVVAWVYGFDANGYDDSPVCVYTDDHYATFQEFNNLGGWNTRFDSDANQYMTLVKRV